MITVPIIFSIDNNVVIQCGVTITSLLKNAAPDTFYDIFILYNQSKLSLSERNRLAKAFPDQSRSRLSFVSVDETVFDSAMVSGHVTAATYYRLIIPKLFPQFDKVIYSDIDIIFQQDLSELYSCSFPNGELVAATLDLAINNLFYFQSSLPLKIGKTEKNYFNAGFLVMNLKLMREDNIVDAFLRLVSKNYDQHDQDILNIVCDGRVQFLPSLFNFQLNHFANYMWGRTEPDIHFGELLKGATLHYTWKNKPWNSLECVASDTWWHYYKQSPFFDDIFYFKRQQDQIEAVRNDYHNRSNKQLFFRILANIKHKIFK